MSNAYSSSWFEIFLEAADPEQTAAEVAFLIRHLPQPQYNSVVDLCCGSGRHARALAHAGYAVTAVDSNREMIEMAIAAGNGDAAKYLLLDMRTISALQGPYDAFVNLWQSFGYFDAGTNRDILCQIGSQLRSRGRLILDVYHRVFFERHQGERTFEKSDVVVTESKRMKGDRLTVTLTYGNKPDKDEFEWQLYTPEELTTELETIGFRCIIACTGFREQSPVSAEEPRMQLVFEK